MEKTIKYLKALSFFYDYKSLILKSFDRFFVFLINHERHQSKFGKINASNFPYIIK